MIRKKNSFFTFCFSFLPGAGQMYMGFMKRGVSLMSAFFLLCFLSSWLNLGPILYVVPIIWFFAFFDTFNLRGMPDDEFYAMEDDFIMIPGLTKEKTRVIQSKYRTILALALILVGFMILWNNICDMIFYVLPYESMQVIRSFGEYFPQLLIGFGIIILGIYLIIGKKKELDTKDNIRELEDKGGF